MMERLEDFIWQHGRLVWTILLTGGVLSVGLTIYGVYCQC